MTKIHQATKDDLPALSILFDAYRIFYKKESDIDAASTFLQERMEAKESVVYIAYDEGVAVGFTQLYPLFSSTRMKRTWLLNDLYVDANHRGKGISKMLINAAKDLARTTGAAGVSLETEKSNMIGNALYPATDFEVDKDHNFYFWTA